MFSSLFGKWLDTALDIGLSEYDFWNMTIGEYERYLKSWTRRKKQERKEKASFDYMLADLIGLSIGRFYKGEFPDKFEYYSEIFKEDAAEIEKAKQQRQNELNALHFKQAAARINKNFKNKEVAK